MHSAKKSFSPKYLVSFLLPTFYSFSSFFLSPAVEVEKIFSLSHHVCFFFSVVFGTRAERAGMHDAGFHFVRMREIPYIL